MLFGPKTEWVPETDGNKKAFPKKRIFDTSSKEVCRSLTFRKFSPEDTMTIVCKVFNLQVGVKGKPSRDSIQLGTIRSWGRKAVQQKNDNGESVSKESLELDSRVEKLVQEAARSLGLCK